MSDGIFYMENGLRELGQAWKPRVCWGDSMVLQSQTLRCGLRRWRQAVDSSHILERVGPHLLKADSPA